MLEKANREIKGQHVVVTEILRPGQRRQGNRNHNVNQGNRRDKVDHNDGDQRRHRRDRHDYDDSGQERY